MHGKETPKCARCSVKTCENPGGKISDGSPALGKLPGFCPMKLMPEVFSEANAEYEKSTVREFARLASVQESHVLIGLLTDCGRSFRGLRS